MIKLLPVSYETKVTGQATVLQVFEITAKNKQAVKVAGCRVNEGTMEKGKQAKVLRNGKTVFEGMWTLHYVFGSLLISRFQAKLRL